MDRPDDSDEQTNKGASHGVFQKATDAVLARNTPVYAITAMEHTQQSSSIVRCHLRITWFPNAEAISANASTLSIVRLQAPNVMGVT